MHATDSIFPPTVSVSERFFPVKECDVVVGAFGLSMM
jgi:hypothetical protein